MRSSRASPATRSRVASSSEAQSARDASSGRIPRTRSRASWTTRRGQARRDLEDDGGANLIDELLGVDERAVEVEDDGGGHGARGGEWGREAARGEARDVDGGDGDAGVEGTAQIGARRVDVIFSRLTKSLAARAMARAISRLVRLTPRRARRRFRADLIVTG